MEKIHRKKMELKPGAMLNPVPAVLVSVSDQSGRDNLITIAWAGTVCTRPPMVSIAVRPERHSYQMLLESGEFVINLVSRDMVFATDLCGVKSGRDLDKFEATGLTKAPAEKVKTKLVAESPVNLECVVRQRIPLGSHDLFLAEIVQTHVSEALMDENGRMDLEKADLVAYAHGTYYSLGETLGTFGYSVRKSTQKSQKKDPKKSRKNIENPKKNKGKTEILDKPEKLSSRDRRKKR